MADKNCLYDLQVTRTWKTISYYYLHDIHIEYCTKNQTTYFNFGHLFWILNFDFVFVIKSTRNPRVLIFIDVRQLFKMFIYHSGSVILDFGNIVLNSKSTSSKIPEYSFFSNPDFLLYRFAIFDSSSWISNFSNFDFEFEIKSANTNFHQSQTFFHNFGPSHSIPHSKCRNFDFRFKFSNFKNSRVPIIIRVIVLNINFHSCHYKY